MGPSSPQHARTTWAGQGAPDTSTRAAVHCLVALDDRITSGAPGVVLVRAPSVEVARAIRQHVARRARATHTVVVASPRAGAPLWQDVLLQLAPTGPSAKNDAAHGGSVRVLAALAGRKVVVVAPLPCAASWDESVARELAEHPILMVFVDAAAAWDDGTALEGETFEAGGDLSAEDRERWWSVVRASASRELEIPSLPSLETWWQRARALEPEASFPRRHLTPEERALLRSLALVGRPWRKADLDVLDASADLVAALVRDGFVEDGGGWLTLGPTSEGVDLAEDATAPRDLASLAAALLSRAAGDAWALTRAAELYLLAGDLDHADAAIDRGLAGVEDAVARTELTERWVLAVAKRPPSERVLLECRAAERALAVGEAEEAHLWARAASLAASDDPEVILLLGRSLVALGDLVAAEVTLRRGQRGLRPEGDEKAAALLAVELAEVAYLKGDMAAAASTAAEAMALAGARVDSRAAAAKARNTLGKILLAEAKWDLADRHFAEDALSAASYGDTTAELRARLNRGIAFLSNGALDEARSVFEAVLAEGERVADFRASAFALDNLAVVATWRHDYADALALSERTLKLRQRLGDRLTTARIVGNLAELRRKLGLVEHAEHAIAFGRRALGPGMPPERSAHFSFVAARVALDRGHVETAQREITRAIRDAELAGHKRILAEAHRVSTRIALEDGDLAKARSSLVASRELTATDEARAEVAVLDALIARAAGDDAEELALEALGLARQVGEEEALLEIHLLLCETYRGRGDIDAARAHLAQAVALREQVSAGLPPEVVTAFLARRDVAQITRLEGRLVVDGPSSSASVGGSTPSILPSAPSSGKKSSAPLHADLVGTDPAMRTLHATIKKVARSSSTVLIRGESGTGKELVATALHKASDRAAGPLVTVNCAALVETLLLSELFGHEKGAFTGATARRRGRFELAEGGTLFLDEIGDISAKTQVALLRVLQERTFERVGGTTSIRADVQIICATHRDLRGMVERGEFREDLYYRLRGITLEVPALRSRTGDIPALAQHLLARIADERDEAPKSLAPAAVELLQLHKWPGNVRELENALRAASLFADGTVIDDAHLTENVDDLRATAQRAGLIRADVKTRPSDTPSSPPSAPTSPFGRDESRESLVEVSDDLEGEGPLPSGEANATAVAYAQVRQGALSLSDLKRQIERDCIARALAETKGNITKAATLLGMKRPRLSQLVKQYGLAAVLSEAQ